MEGRDELYLVALAGLLHDVGPEFISAYVPGKWQGHMTKAVALADRLSAGGQVEKQAVQAKQLLSIFCRLEADGQQISEEQYRYWPLKCLELRDDVLFPQESWDSAHVESAYGKLWKEFAAKADALHKAHQGNGDLAVYVENLLLLMQRYTWCIPSTYYRSLPDVSFYDHSRMTAALAACLVDQDEDQIDAMLNGEKVDEPLALLVGGDVSGVQDFIYTITAKGAASALRGRSFYLQLLTEAVARYVLRRLELPITNLIYQGGGGFYLLARAGDAERLTEIQREVSRVLLAHHRGDLYLALASEPLVVTDFYAGRISEKWDELARALRNVKQRRFAELGDEIGTLFVPQGHGGNQDEQCQVCGREHPKTKELDDVRKCPQCLSYEELGDNLRRANYLWFEERDAEIPRNPLKIEPGGWQKVLNAFGLNGGVNENLPQRDGATQRLILALNDAALADLSPAAHVPVGRRFLVNVTPTINQEEINDLRGKVEDLPQDRSVKPFSVMEAQSQGIKRLGVLRMDVDNLGKLFAEGLGDEATLSRVAALSFTTSLYFEGWVGHIAKTLKENEHDVLYSIYSGGDDLFFVGAWDVVVELARRIRVDLTRFSATHPGIHASAGVALVDGKYPLYQAAADAGVAEHTAKSLKWRDEQGEKHKKDAITFLNRTLPWERFGQEASDEAGIHTVHALAHRLVQMVNDEGAPQALLQRLIQLQQMYEKAAEERRNLGEELNQAGEEQAYWGPWMWRGHYALMRMAGKKDGEPWDTIRTLAKRLTGDSFRAIEWIGLAARWADLLTR